MGVSLSGARSGSLYLNIYILSESLLVYGSFSFFYFRLKYFWNVKATIVSVLCRGELKTALDVVSDTHF